MNIIQLAPHVGKLASGYSYTVPRVCRGLLELGHTVNLITCTGEVEKLNDVTQQKSGSIEMVAGLVGITTELKHSIFNAAEHCDILHSNSLWRMTNIYPSWAASKFKKPHIVSPRGTLNPHARHLKGLSKSIFSYALQQRALQSAALLHATSEGEYRDIRESGIQNPVAIIPNGVDIPSLANSRAEQSQRVLLFVGRIHPIKGLELLFECWRELTRQNPEWELRIVGPLDSDYALALKEKVLSAQIPHVVFTGGKSGRDKELEMQSADLLVLPSQSENFGMVVAEALAAGTPVITTTGTPWSLLSNMGCGWWVERSKHELCETLHAAMSTERDALIEMGNRGRDWMIKEYSWKTIVKDLMETYEWLINGTKRPDFIREE